MKLLYLVLLFIIATMFAGMIQFLTGITAVQSILTFILIAVSILCVRVNDIMGAICKETKE